MFSAIATIVSALIAAGVSIYQVQKNKKLQEHLTGSQQEQNQFNAEQAQIQRDYSAEEAQKSRDFTMFMQRNKYQMETQSMQNAGVNPAMVYGGGNLVPTAANGSMGQGAVANGQGAGNASLPNLMEMIPSLLAAARMPLELKQMKADIENTEAETEGMVLKNYITDNTKEALIQVTNMEPQEKQATIDKVIAETKSEGLRQQLLGWNVMQAAMDYDQQKRMNELIFEAQQLENDYQRFVNNHQEAEWQKRMDAIDSQIEEAYTAAYRNMNEGDRAAADAALASAEEQYVSGAQTEKTQAETETEKARKQEVESETYKNVNTPAQRLVGDFTRGLQGVRNLAKGIGQRVRQNRELHGTRNVQKKRNRIARQVKEVYATTGQAIEEYGDVK